MLAMTMLMLVMMMMLVIMTMTIIVKHLLRSCSRRPFDEATLQHGSPTVHYLYVLTIIIIMWPSFVLNLTNNHTLSQSFCSGDDA